jgi:hypothetical protein
MKAVRYRILLPKETKFQTMAVLEPLYAAVESCPANRTLLPLFHHLPVVSYCSMYYKYRSSVRRGEACATSVVDFILHEPVLFRSQYPNGL